MKNIENLLKKDETTDNEIRDILLILKRKFQTLYDYYPIFKKNIDLNSFYKERITEIIEKLQELSEVI